MSLALKKVISITLISFLCLHFSFIFIHTFPVKVKSTKFSILSKAYFSTFFHQNWNVFVPAPNYQHYLFIRHRKDGNWTNWKDILGLCVENNRHNKFRGNEAITLLFSNSLIYELNVLPKKSLFFKKLPNNREFTVLQYEVNNYLKLNEQAKEGEDYEMMIFSLEPDSKRTFYFKDLTISH